jgi:hypothetical protein
MQANAAGTNGLTWPPTVYQFMRKIDDVKSQSIAVRRSYYMKTVSHPVCIENESGKLIRKALLSSSYNGRGRALNLPNAPSASFRTTGPVSNWI